MLKRHQLNTLLIWLGLPFVLFLVLTLINPSYMGLIFEDRLLLPVFFCMFATLEIINFAVLVGGFALINRSLLDRGKNPKLAEGILSVVTLVLFTFPVLWIVFFWPSLVTVMSKTPPSP